MKKKREPRELTDYESDLQLHQELAYQAWLKAPPRVSAKQAAKDDAAIERDLHRDAQRKHRAALRELAATAPVLVYCTACGKPKSGTRREMAHFRTCCDTSTATQKHCRGCAAVMTRAEYFGGKYASSKGWATLATCAGCKK